MSIEITDQPTVDTTLVSDMSDLTDSKGKKSDSKLYTCECCNYSTHVKFNYETHLSSNKHKKRENNIATVYKCNLCGIEYKLRQSLYKHMKTCTGITKDNIDPEASPLTPNITIEIESTPVSENNQVNLNSDALHLSQNIQLPSSASTSDNNTTMNDILKKLQNIEENMEKQMDVKIQELKKELSPPNVSNLRGPYKLTKTDKVLDFLNIHCINAYNYDDMIPQNNFTGEELNNIGKGIYSPNIITFIQTHNKKLDYFKNEKFLPAIMNIFKDCFGHLSIYERPIHCINTKLKKFYIKENDQWIKLEDTQKIKDIIQLLSDICIPLWLKYDYDTMLPFLPSNDLNEKLSEEQISYRNRLCTNAYMDVKSLYDNFRIGNKESKMNTLMTMIGEFFYLNKDILNGV